MPRTSANGVEIDYEVFGLPADRPLFLLRGLGTQRIQWHPGFCQRLVQAGHRLVVFDNRDAGLSTHLHGAGRPDLARLFEAQKAGQTPEVPYTLDDMADDVVGLMDALALESAHVAGISMGGMITQTLGYRHPDRVRSLVSIMSSTGNPALPPPTREAMEALMTPSPAERGAYIDHSLHTARVIGSPGYPLDDEAHRELAGRCFDRSFDPGGVARQFAAIQAHGDRRPGLRRVAAPTLVIHGLGDPLVSLEGGRDTAQAIPGAELVEIPGMGHDLPPGLFGTLADAISAHTEKAEAGRA
ncbi:MAG: alpha/beta hydrolase [Deltaproteobacteria bacterium]|jgi:pimeloyl-ACP methyl ester carboxylesterase|nr:alpha/beta hydrolase [Deltaproteobacteria bacterium]